MFEAGDTLLKIGNAARELSHKVAAIANCAGNGRGANRRSGLGERGVVGTVNRPRCGRRIGAAPRAGRQRRSGLGEQRREIIGPPIEIAARQIFGVWHRVLYIPLPAGLQPPAARRHRFDAALAPKRCIVRVGDRSGPEMARA